MLVTQGVASERRGEGRMPLWANSAEPSPANSVVFLRSPRPHHGVGHLIPDRSVELHRAVSASSQPPHHSKEVRGHETHRG
jgi:hypothetical protein